MTADPLFWRVVRKCWPMCGGAWGAWLVLRGSLGVSIHGDSFGGAIYWMFGLFLAIVFFLVGAAIAALVGHPIHWLFRRGGASVATAVTVATLAIALAVWQAGEFVVMTSAGLRAPVAAKPKPGSARVPTPQTDREPPGATCRDPRPVDARQAALWDAECR